MGAFPSLRNACSKLCPTLCTQDWRERGGIPAVTHQTDCKGILAEQSGVCSCPELPEMVVVEEEKPVVLPLEWQVEGGLQEGQTGQVEEVEHHNQNLQGQKR